MSDLRNTPDWVLNPRKNKQLTNITTKQTKKLKSPECRVLELLLEHPGKILTKDSLLSNAWPGRVVTEASLTQSIAQIRLALGDNGKKQTYIKTLPGIGYSINENMVKLESDTEKQIRCSKSNSACSNNFSTLEESIHDNNIQKNPIHNDEVKETLKNSHHINNPGTFTAKNLAKYTLLLTLTSISSANLFSLFGFFYQPSSLPIEKWHEETFDGIQYNFIKSNSSEKLSNYLKSEFSSLKGQTIKKLFISPTIHNTYVVCVYQPLAKDDDTMVRNFSFNTTQSSYFIKEALIEHCQ